MSYSYSFTRSEIAAEHPADGLCPVCSSNRTNHVDFSSDRITYVRCSDCGCDSEVDWQ